jgi:hypothetical protein
MSVFLRARDFISQCESFQLFSFLSMISPRMTGLTVKKLHVLCIQQICHSGLLNAT